MEMVAAINKANFENRREVTCYSCHRGNLKPVSIPTIPGEVLAEHGEAASASQPNTAEPQASDANTKQIVDSILDQYVAALGEVSKLQNITSRTERGNIDLGGKQFPMEAYFQAPNKQVSVLHLPNGDSVTGSNGAVGWISVPGRHTQWMSDSEVDSTRLEADLRLPLRMKQTFAEFRLESPQKIEGHDVSVIAGVRAGKPPVSFYFDSSSRLLLRLVRYIETPLGLNPVQIDYSDYRDLGGVKVAYLRIVARPRDRYAIQLEEVRNNAPIEGERFTPPPSTNP